jgi:hypothetical protein
LSDESFTNTVMRIAAKYYPPKTNGELRNLHKTIVESTAADHHKISVLYYLLLEFDHPTGKRQFSTVFERTAFLPAKYSIYMKGLWHMDRQEFEVCTQSLVEAQRRIVPSWTMVISQHITPFYVLTTLQLHVLHFLFLHNVSVLTQHYYLTIRSSHS